MFIFKLGQFNFSSPARTGKANNNKNEVTNIDQTNNGISNQVIPGALILNIVVIKLIAPNILDKPLKCKLKIAKSTEPLLWNCIDDSGGYKVHPSPGPSSMNNDKINKSRDGGNNQKDILFSRGKAISIAPIIIGTR